MSLYMYIYIYIYIHIINTNNAYPTVIHEKSHNKIYVNNGRNFMILINLKLSLRKEFTLCFTYSFSLVLHFLFFVFNIYLYIDLYSDISINIPP